ncbi:hypothetical protein [Streptomyces muensis]|nr:hypothetical protein [Streptomyces muensis]
MDPCVDLDMADLGMADLDMVELLAMLVDRWWGPLDPPGAG